MANISETDARFNPAIPKEQAPDWWKESRSIQQPQSPKAGEFIFSGLAALTGEAVHGLDTAQKIGLDEQIRTGVEKLKDEQIASMQATKDSLQAANATGKPLPAELQNLNENLTSIYNARANGKISLTDYDGRLVAFMKDVRARNPGYRDYIDEVGRRAIGYDPANQQIRQMAQDINSYVSGKKNDLDKIVDHLLSPDMASRGGARLAEGIRSGLIKDPFKAYADFTQNTYSLKVTEEDVKRARELDKPAAHAAIAQSAYEFAHLNFANFQTISGLGSIEDSVKMVQDAKANPDKYTPEQLRQAGDNIKMLGERLWDRYQAIATEPDNRNPGGVSTIERAGGLPEFVAQAKPFFDIYKQLGDHIAKGEWDAAGAQARLVQDWKTAASFGLGSTEWGQLQFRLDALKQTDPEMYEILHKELILGNQEMAPKMRAWLMNGAMKIASGESTVAKEVQDAISKKILIGKVYADYVGLIEGFKSPTTSPERRAELFHAFFDQSNGALLDSFKKDYVDTSKGYPRQIPGKYSVFFQLTDPAVTAQVVKMGGDAKKQYADRAGDWMDKLFQADIDSLPNNVTWDSEKHQLRMPPRSNVGAGLQASDLYATNQGTVTKLNHALDQYAAVIQATRPGADVSVEVHKLLVDMGAFQEKPDLIRTLGQRVLKSLMGPPEVPLTKEGPAGGNSR